MTEPFLLAMPGKPDGDAWSMRAPADFRDPTKCISLVPMTSRIMGADRELYTEAEIKSDPQFLRSAKSNTARNAIRVGDGDADWVSVRSNRTGVPCAAMFFLDGREKLFGAIHAENIEDYYIIFITQDEVLLARKADFPLSNIKRTVKNIRNKMQSLYPEGCPVLATEVFVYDKSARRYEEA